jgi:hypothetical protein
MSQDIKVEYSKDMQSLRKKNQAEILEIKSPLNKIKNTVESLSSKRGKSGRQNFRSQTQNIY